MADAPASDRHCHGLTGFCHRGKVKALKGTLHGHWDILELFGVEFLPNQSHFREKHRELRKEEKSNLPQRTQRAQRKNIINSLAYGIFTARRWDSWSLIPV